MSARAPKFLVGATVLGLAIVGLRLAIASREWFYGDDFFFLTWVRAAHWSWHETFLPTSARLIAAYRPFGLDGYFLANFALFGWNALGYYATGLVLQALTGLGVVRIALHYGLDRRVALASGLFILVAKSSSIETYEIADHNYICAALTSTLALSCFLDYMRSQRAVFRWLSCLMLAIGVLCNEIAACVPLTAFAAALLADSGPLLARARRAAASLWPQLIVTLLFLDFRTSGVPSRQRGWFYEIDFGLDMVSNTRGNLEFVMGGKLGLWCAALLLTAAVAWSVLAKRRAVLELGSQPVQLALVSCVWLCATLLPFSVLALPTARFALVLLPAAALALGAICNALLPLLRPAWQAPALLFALAALTPWSAMYERLERPRGAAYREAHALATQALTETKASCVTVVCNGPGLADASQCSLFREGSFNTALWDSIDPDRTLAVGFSEGGSEAFLERVRNVHDCVRLYLKRDLSVTTDPPNAAPEAALLSMH